MQMKPFGVVVKDTGAEGGELLEAFGKPRSVQSEKKRKSCQKHLQDGGVEKKRRKGE